MFGEHELKTQFIKVGGKKIHLLEEKGGIVRYRRDDVERLIKANDEPLKIRPASAIGYGVNLLMIKFEEPITVSPGDSLTGFAEAPIEVVAEIGGVEIDRFILGREKYALYGAIEAGVICRYHVSPFYLEEPEAIGVAKLLLSNPSNEWKSLEKVVLPIKNTPMYYTEKKAYYPLLVVILKNHIPEVNNTGKPPKEGLNIVGNQLSLPNFLMRW